MLTREEFLSAPRIVIEKVMVPIIKTEMYVRSLTAGEREQYEKGMFIRNKDKMGLVQSFDESKESAKVRLVLLATCDENGARYFRDEDYEAVSKQNSAVIEALYKPASRLSAFSDSDLEDLLKN